MAESREAVGTKSGLEIKNNDSWANTVGGPAALAEVTAQSPGCPASN